MSINKAIWGVENPTNPHRLKIIAIFVFMALAAFGWYSDFIPSKEWSSIGGAAAAVISTAITITVWWLHLKGHFVLNYRDITSKPIKILVTYLVIPAMFFMLFWTAIVHGFASGMNIIFGTPKEVITILVKNHRSSRRSCEYHLEGKYLNRAIPSYICISKKYYEASPKTVSVRLSGKETYFGYLVQSFHEQQF